MGKMKQLCVDEPGKGPCKVPKGMEVDRLESKSSLKQVHPKPKKKMKRNTGLKNWSKIQPLLADNTYIENRMKKDLATIGSSRSLGR